jgi:GNAT superfamily N-acetyltransferase
MKMSVFFEHQCGLLSALESARTADTSFIAEPRAGITDLHLMPFFLFPWTGDRETSEDATTTYQNKIDDGTLVVKRLKQNVLSIAEREGMGQQLVEVARADFDGDGIEEILLFEYCYATHGTLGFGGVTILRRRGPDALFERVIPASAYDVTDCVPADLSEAEIQKCLAVITSGEAVDPEFAEAELPLAKALAIARVGKMVVGAGAVKRERIPYASSVAERSGFEFRRDTPELGYVAVDKRHRGQGLSHRLVEKLLTKQQGSMFATTDNAKMKASLLASGFSQKGHGWMGHRGMLSLWIKD